MSPASDADGPVRDPEAGEAVLALTQGDPAGIGPELALKAWLAGRNGPRFFVLSDPAFLARMTTRLGLDVPIVEATPESAAQLFVDALPVVPLDVRVMAEPGRADPASAEGTLASIAQAVRLTRQGRARAIVTNPIAKHVLYEAGFRHPGHTEYLAALSRMGDDPAPLPVMMIWSAELAVVPVTIHIPLASVPQRLTADLIVETGLIVARDLVRRFGIARPRLAVAGLNPHAGEAGAMGREEIEIVSPAIARLRERGIDVSGPWPADTMFHAGARRRYDAAIAMYHDQALIPIKTIAFDEAVNVTLGLPFVRTSPDHGTAFDIAGRGIARPQSLIAALALAVRLSGAGQPA